MHKQYWGVIHLWYLQNKSKILTPPLPQHTTIRFWSDSLPCSTRTSIIEHQRTPHPSPYFQVLQQWDKYTCVKVFKNGPSKICGRQPLKNLKEYGLPRAGHTPSNYSKAVFHKVYLVHSWIVCVPYAIAFSFAKVKS